MSLAGWLGWGCSVDARGWSVAKFSFWVQVLLLLIQIQQQRRPTEIRLALHLIHRGSWLVDSIFRFLCVTYKSPKYENCVGKVASS